MTVQPRFGWRKTHRISGEATACQGTARSIRHTLPRSRRPVGADDAPVLAPPSPFLGDVHHSQVQHFQQTVIEGGNGLGLGHLSHCSITLSENSDFVVVSYAESYILALLVGLSPAVFPHKRRHFVNTVLTLGVDAGVVKVGVSKALIEYHLRFHPGPVQLHAVAQGLQL